MSTEWKLVPVEPTSEMCRAANGLSTNRNRYAAMLDVSPQPPALGGEPIKRYSFDQTACPELDPEGLYVEFEDAAPLLADNAVLRDRISQRLIDLTNMRAERDTLKARCEELEEFDIEAAARKLAECMGYPWFGLIAGAKERMRAHAKSIIGAASNKAAPAAKDGAQ
jgi:hypothetical protein